MSVACTNKSVILRKHNVEMPKSSKFSPFYEKKKKKKKRIALSLSKLYRLKRMLDTATAVRRNNTWLK